MQFTLQFKGREMAHLDLGRELFAKIKEALWPVSKIERDSKMEGRRMTLLLQPDHKQPGAVKPGAGGSAPAATGPGRAPAMSAGSSLNVPPVRTATPVAAAASTPAPATRLVAEPVGR